MALIPQRTSLVAQVAASLREGIEQGQWTEHLPGELELCRQFQVSRTTLRGALETLTREGWLRTTQGRRRQVLKTVARAEGRRLVVLLSAAPLERMGSFRIFLVDVLRGQLAKAGYELELHANHDCFTRRPEAALEKLVREKKAAAWVLFSATAVMQRWFMTRRLPCLIAGSRHEGVTLPMVELDCRALGQHAAWQFLSRQHRQLAVLAPALGMAGDELTVRGFREACAQVTEAHVRVVEHDGTPAGIVRQLNLLLRRNAPTGLLVTSATHALTVVTHLNQTEIRVPQDVSLIVRDSDPLLDYVLPVLTRYVMKPELFGRQLAGAVVTLAREGAAAVKDRHLVAEFLRGETLANLSAKKTSGR